MPKPIWLLDIDGVINAVTRTKFPTHAWPLGSWAGGEAMGNSRMWPIKWASPVIDFINEVHESGLAEIRWHTTWQHQAKNVAELVGLPEFPVHDASSEYTPDAWKGGGQVHVDGWWKLPGVWRALRENDSQPVVWTDDDITYELTDTQLQSLRAAGPIKLMSPDSATGLCQRHLREIREFLEMYKEIDEEE